MRDSLSRLLLGAMALPLTCAWPSLAISQPNRPHVQNDTSICDVVEGPRLRNCQFVRPPGLDPAKGAQLAKWAEATPACNLTGAKVGVPFEFHSWFIDAPKTWEHLNDTAHEPDWVKRPDSSVMADSYPRGAGGRSGRVVLRCRVPLSGVPSDCVIVSEDPTGFGFADAALRVARTFCWNPKFVDGQAVDTGTMAVPLQFVRP